MNTAESSCRQVLSNSRMLMAARAGAHLEWSGDGDMGYLGLPCASSCVSPLFIRLSAGGFPRRSARRITAAVRTGDTTSGQRAAMLRTPPHILVTTPESLYLLLTAARSREMLRTVRTVIVDEIHAVIGTRRGAHLALSLERLQQVAAQPLLRIGLSATQKPIEMVAQWLIGCQSAIH